MHLKKEREKSSIKMIPGVNCRGVDITGNFMFVCLMYLVVQIFILQKKKKKPELTQKEIEPTSSQLG